MAGEESRSIGALLKDIAGNLQEIVRGELRLARAEIGEQFAKARRGVLLLVVGGVLALMAGIVLLFALVYLLALVVPQWAAALIVAAVVGVIAAVLVSTGAKQMRDVHVAPIRTSENIKETVQWVKAQTR